MKKKKKELDVDFIGGSGPLTKEEEKRISDIIRSRKSRLKSGSEKIKDKIDVQEKSDCIAAPLPTKCISTVGLYACF